ncbi:pentatricopeptide repeat-containing protein At2g45350, chloroplastic-like [Amaranthus tricolor]|uniref:pentatricopeptide repeat-containing protein At2g45350, chloroplastic-like n=1 Tax=Amaranthus tricolor TaxID=29722 RepID=UPI002586D94F|nr:pentatricopeptide repeat-containing protein At2g45350, chloroplastic-like [Amaranthus tricolor]
MLICANSIQPWNSKVPTFSILHNCKTVNDIKQIHARLIATGFIKNPNFTTKLILKLCSFPQKPLINFARFLLLSEHALIQEEQILFDPFLFNAVIKSFSVNNEPKQALLIFNFMLDNGVCVDKYSFSLILKVCSRYGYVKEGMQIHGLLRKLEIGSELYLQNCLISLYVKCGSFELARQVFDRMPDRDLVSYNAMIDGYVKAGLISVARELFDCMEIKNLISWNSMIAGYMQSRGNLDKAWELFKEMPKRDLVTWNLMIDGLAKCNEMESAHDLFERMPERDAITWATMIDGYAKTGCVDIARNLFDQAPEKDIVVCNTMMAGYVQSGNFVEALKFFYDILNMDNSFPDRTSLLIVLSAIAQLGRVDEGITVHSYIKSNGIAIGGKLDVALIDMYSKCGCIDSAIQVFENVDLKDVDHWNAMIGGLAVHGLGELAFDLYTEMRKQSIEPDDITFIGLLSACGHSGLVKEGKICFELMRRVHKLEPKLQHYGCMVDILGRAGRLIEAKEFIAEMPIEPNDIVWRTLLSACIYHGNLDLGQQVAERLTRLDLSNLGSYVLLSNMYAGFGKWDDVSKIRTFMANKALKKLPGFSSIELNGSVHEFLVRDKSHPQTSQVYSLLDKFSASGHCLNFESEVTELELVNQ